MLISQLFSSNVGRRNFGVVKPSRVRIGIDLSLLLNEMPAAKFASEGQQRTVALALKLGQARLFLEARGSTPDHADRRCFW